MKHFDYAVIRYMPDPIRGEIINIGLLVFNEVLDIRLLKNASKLRMFDNNSVYSHLADFESSLLSAYSFAKSPADFKEVLSSFSTGIIISNLARFSIDHLNQYEAKVLNLFDTLIKPHSVREKTSRSSSRLITTLKRKFEAIKILGQDESELSEHKIIYNYVLNSSTGLSADFLLKNGIYHLSEVIDYDVADTKAKFKETAMKLMTFAEGKKSLEGEVASYFVYSASIQKERDVIQQINLAETYSSKMFNMSSKEDSSKYFQIIENAVGYRLPLIH